MADGSSLVRRFTALMDEYDEMTERAGGWVSRIPQADKDAWGERKRILLGEIGRLEFDRQRRDARLIAIAALSTVSL